MKKPFLPAYGLLLSLACTAPPLLAQPACGNSKVELRLQRFATSEWSLSVVDMRTLRQMQAKRGSYDAPNYSLRDLAAVTGADRVLVSAGMTESLSAPVPVGLLKVAGSVRSKGNTASRILDGVLCVRADRSMRLLSELTPSGRRIPQNWSAATAECVHAVQAGPMLLDKGQPLIAQRGPRVDSRVFVALDNQGQIVIGHSPKATTFDLACTLAASGRGLTQAIALQGDEIGGALFGSKSGAPAATWGQDSTTIASALELRRR